MTVLMTRYRSLWLRFSALGLAALCLSINALASPAPLSIKDSAPRTYTVVKGDTLWGISALYLDNPWLWPRLWQANPEISNPHLIYPGDQLTLIWRDGQPTLSLKPMIKLSPQARVLKKPPLTTVEEALLLPYLLADRLILSQELNDQLRILGSNQGKQYLSQPDALYLEGQHEAQHWGIYRPMNEFQRANHSMRALRRLATAHLVESTPSMTTLAIDELNQEIRANDIALPEISLESLPLSTTFFPRPAPHNARPRLLGTLEGSQYAAKHHVVVIDHGREEGLEQGSMFELYQAGQTVYQKGEQYTDKAQRASQVITLPAKKVGTLMVIRPYPTMSLALITSSQAAIDNQIVILPPEVSDSATSTFSSLHP
ncbi:LysM peptidoglycan-binding domain-containing protein [Vibrio metschnikovii]|uniref:LysM peptidoglycan-binding domain-containing protein n=2 Tax=Unclassified Bacteria TaxID=49928 RepID=A0AAU6UUF6_UNCXX|nr:MULTISPECIES: LysM peptidoglycan-binding domain-containing protein [unclassified Vibrio]EKO3576867.1 LysM peptidoglycan-binding domain-containing protein [Vibrio metschnikovii]EKO3593485.1 LysM peptidoglycan-binding domain-containing protein [Vibrio metschnikovii]EKO3642478.1 LysM peptidoglycan-binding domain-containing protein [Vibrio metschnikovii]EKO3666809.1 LysM peptidoglycan-binding domain-containing protein [Vibrio metschnikovii]EKO3698220.1 LysM peptidoglycan-binding domain-containi